MISFFNFFKFFKRKIQAKRLEKQQARRIEDYPASANMERKSFGLVVLILPILGFILLLIWHVHMGQKGIGPKEIVDETYELPANNASIPSSLGVSIIHPKTALTTLPLPPLDNIPNPADVAFMQEKQKELQGRLAAPLFAYSAPAAESGDKQDQDVIRAPLNANTAFMQQANATQARSNTYVAKPLGSLDDLVLQGTYIHAVLEPATDSDLPGSLRAVVSDPVYSANGNTVLVPAGSRLDGVYKSSVANGQTRIFIVWTRLITPDGISVNLDSEGVDDLGMAGNKADEVDRHFWQRFSLAGALSMIDAAVANVGVRSSDQDNSIANYRSNLADSFGRSANQSYQQDADIRTTLKSYQGKTVNVYVQHDLNFSQAMNQIKPTVEIF